MKVVLAIVGAVLLLGAGVGAGFFLKPASEPTETIRKPLFMPMERFVISVSSEQSSRYLVLELTLVTYDENTLPVLTEASPLLRNALVSHFSNRTHKEVREAFQNIEPVQKELLDKFNQTLLTNKFPNQIEQVLITNVFIQ